MGQTLVKHIHVTITLDSLVTNLVTVDIDLFNPLDTPLHVLFIQSDGKVDGTTFAHFEHAFDNFVIGPGETVNSGDIPNVLLTQGALASLDIIPLGMLDAFSAVTAQIGDGGYVVPWLQVVQLGVPTAYDLNLAGLLNVGLPSLKAMVSSMSESSVAATATTKESQSSGSASTSRAAETTSESAEATRTSSGDSDGGERPASTSAESASATSKSESEPTAAPEVSFNRFAL